MEQTINRVSNTARVMAVGFTGSYKSHINFRHACKIHANPVMYGDSERYLGGYQFDSGVVSRYCRSVYFYCMNHLYTGIGMSNANKGMEFIDGRDFASPGTVGSHGLVVVGNKRRKTKACALFADIVDFLAYKTMAGMEMPSLACVPEECDCIILCSACNLCAFLDKVENYEKAYCFFPKTVAGETLTKTMAHLYEDGIEDMSRIYDGNGSMAECLKGMPLWSKATTRKRISTVRRRVAMV